MFCESQAACSFVGATTLSIMALSIMWLCDTQHKKFVVLSAIIQSHDLFIAMLNIVMLNVVMLNVVRLNVIMLSVVAPFHQQWSHYLCRWYVSGQDVCRLNGCRQSAMLPISKLFLLKWQVIEIQFFWFKQVLDQGPEHRESKMTVLCPLTTIIQIS